ncbi:glycosyltransferase family 2 protein [Mucilaginibacter sp. KACC 22063]|uniref:glycosyltransferase family 2 protein n=1 Tax=Mucilaginibacter sp. KACC 22063 TaxID=3025666 RepID=UPI00236705FC|nr:glycosyltransferase family 2 protein [Mucilaginibacter sp. KACC 22063]WDF53671.1 glycosyltransferase family 2 protein [Mucilaginibacter sp. KACC 22063]
MRPIAIPAVIAHYINDTITPAEVSAAYQQLRKTGEPEITVSIPAYNEETTIVQTLASLCDNITPRSVEIVVVNNNSKDRTEELVLACGVTCIRETTQGITVSRNAGLAKATGKYILNADADTIYPKDWIEEMVKPLANSDKVAITYGRFSFIPVGVTGRFTYFFYEYIADFTRVYNKYFKNEAVNVYGFNSGFRREQGLQVDGFNHPPGTNEDGYLALKLKEKGFGRLYRVTSPKAIVWTTDRRIQIDGGLWKATWKRLKRVFG